MKYPIVDVETKDHLILHGLLMESEDSDKIVISFHGTASNFYEEPYIEKMAMTLNEKGFSFLSVNNRGNAVLAQTWQKCGSAVEKFEDCLLDFDAWIEFALGKNYRTIILMGHSLGSEKTVYYMNKGTHKDKVRGVVLLGFSDSFGNAMKFMERLKCKEELFKEAKELVANNKGEQFLATKWYCHAGLLPKSAESFLNQFSENSQLSKAFPFRLKKLEIFSKINSPILAVISDNDKYTNADVVIDASEHTMMPVEEAAELLRESNPKTQAVIIPETNHDFEGKEEEVSKVVADFLKANF